MLVSLKQYRYLALCPASCAGSDESQRCHRQGHHLAQHISTGGIRAAPERGSGAQTNQNILSTVSR
jgi:hypothetical protein